MALDIKISFSWINYCRLCLLDKGLKIPIFEQEGIHEQIALKIKDCLDIRTYDGDPLPRMICHQCLCKLNTAYELKQKARESIKIILTHLQPLKHVAGVHEYMEDCVPPPVIDQNNEITNEENNIKTPTGKTIGHPTRASNHEKTPDSVGLADDSMLSGQSKGRQTRSKVGRLPRSKVSRLPVGPQDSGPPAQKARITIVPEIVTPSITSNAKERITPSPSASASGQEKEMLAVLSAPKPKPIDNPPESMDSSDSIEEPNKRKRRRITDHFDEALMDTGGNLVLAAGRNRENRPKKKIGPASRTRAVATCLTGPSPWQCILCGCFFLSHNTLRRHYSCCRVCQSCEQEFPSAKEKAIHEMNHISVNLSRFADLKYKCDLCDRAFVTHMMLKQHIRYDHDGHIGQSFYDPYQTSPYVEADSSNSTDADDDCCKCESDDSANTVRLVESEHEDQGQLECHKCGRVFLAKQRLEYHLSVHDTLLKCSYCPWMFPVGPGRRRHQRRAHGDKPNPVHFSCSVCKENFENKSILYIHKKTHGDKGDAREEKVSEGPSKKTELEHCHVCDKLIQPSKFMAHLVQHASDAYPTKSPLEQTDKDESTRCQVCQVVCPNHDQYKIHLAKHALKSPPSSFKCDGCSQTFANVEAINRHSCPGKDTNKQWKNCEHCGQNLPEGTSHVCDNECQICRKIFKSARGQRLHVQHKHENVESQSLSADDGSLESRSTDAVGSSKTFNNVYVKQERPDFEETADDEVGVADSRDRAPGEADRSEDTPGDEPDDPPDDGLENAPAEASMSSSVVSDETCTVPTENPPVRPEPVKTESLKQSANTKGEVYKGTPKIRLRAPESLISGPPPLAAISKIPTSNPQPPGMMKPPPPYRPPLTTETKIAKSIILRRNNGPGDSYSMVLNMSESTTNSTKSTNLRTTAKLPNSSADHSYTASFTPSTPQSMITTIPSSTSALAPRLNYAPPVSSNPVFVTTAGYSNVAQPSSISSQVVSTKIISSTNVTKICGPVSGLNVPSTPSVIMNPKSLVSEKPPARLPVIINDAPKLCPQNQSSIRCVQISSLRSTSTASSDNFSPVPSNQSSLGIGYSNLYNSMPPVPPVPPPTLFNTFQPAPGPCLGEENVLRDVLLGRRMRDEEL